MKPRIHLEQSVILDRTAILIILKKYLAEEYGLPDTCYFNGLDDKEETFTVNRIKVYLANKPLGGE